MNTTKTFDNRSIGIFDSGIGGLSIAKRISEQLPHENLIYVADSQHAPYGEKSTDFITQRVIVIAQQLIKQECKALVIACNTATVNAISQLRAQVDIPIIGVEPAIKPAAKQSLNKKVAVLVTQATSQNPNFQRLIDRHHNGALVTIQPCPGLVELIEQGKQNSGQCYQLLKKYLEPLISAGVDTLVLGCTHYPFVLEAITSITGGLIHVLETATPVTSYLSGQLKDKGLSANIKQTGKHQFFSSKVSEHQQQLFSQLWQTPLTVNALTIL